MSRCYNFCAGPAALPEAVLEIARDDMLEWHGKGLSLMEMSHRSPEVVGVASTPSRLCATCWVFPTITRCCFCKVAPARSLPRCR